MKMMQITSELLSASYIDVELSIVSQIAFNMKLWDLKQRYEPMGGVFESQYKIHIREYRVTTMAPDYRGVKGMEVS